MSTFNYDCNEQKHTTTLLETHRNYRSQRIDCTTSTLLSTLPSMHFLQHSSRLTAPLYRSLS